MPAGWNAEGRRPSDEPDERYIFPCCGVACRAFNYNVLKAEGFQLNPTL